LPLRHLEELIGRLGTAGDVDQTGRKGTLSRYRSFATAAGHHLSGSRAFEDTRASYLLLDGLALGDDTPRLARYLIEDFTHYCTSRKPPDRKVLLLVDEFSALRLGNAAALFERLRSFNPGVVLAAQSIEGLHDDEGERDRLLNSALGCSFLRRLSRWLLRARAGDKRGCPTRRLGPRALGRRRGGPCRGAGRGRQPASGA
jgi:hypothetical protein